MTFLESHALLLLALLVVALAVASYLAHRSHSAKWRAIGDELDELRAVLAGSAARQVAATVEAGASPVRAVGEAVVASLDDTARPHASPAPLSARADTSTMAAVKTGVLLLGVTLGASLLSGCTAHADLYRYAIGTGLFFLALAAVAFLVALAALRRVALVLAACAALTSCTASDWHALLASGNRCAVDVAGGVVDGVADHAVGLAEVALEQGHAATSTEWADAGRALVATAGAAAVRCGVAMLLDLLEHPPALASRDPAAWVTGARGHHKVRAPREAHRAHLLELYRIATASP